MGGKAFSHGAAALHTPRMPPAVYYKLRDEYVSLLLTVFEAASTPIESPGKDSYGDIDVLVHSPVALSTDFHSLTTLLGAERSLITPGSPSASYAVPFPGATDTYIQLDVHLCSREDFAWELFMYCHGDMWNLLGTSLRPFGLTANTRGLNVRIAEIEKLDRKRSMIFLTNDPATVLRFLGLDATQYWNAFESVEAMFLYIAGMRFYRSESYILEDLKGSDKTRRAKRQIYRRFTDEWVPARQIFEAKATSRDLITRESVLEEVLGLFLKRDVYDGTVQEWRQERADLLLKQEAKQQRRNAARGLQGDVHHMIGVK